MSLTEFFRLHHEKILHYNRLQFLFAIILQLIFPFLKTISYDSNGESIKNKFYLIYYFNVDTNNIVIPFIFLIFLILTIYFYFSFTEKKYFDCMPLTLTPIIGFCMFSWLSTLTQLKTLPRAEMYIDLGILILGISIITYYTIYFFNKKLESPINISERKKLSDKNNDISRNSKYEERWIIFLLCFSILPVAVTTPALGIFATHFTNTEQLAFFTAYGIPFFLPESYIFYRISTIVGDILYNPIFFTFISIVVFCTSMFAMRSISMRSRGKKSEIGFIVTALIFLLFINALIIVFLYLFFPWLLIPYWMIYEGKKDPNHLKKGLILIVLILGTGIIIVFMQVLLPIDFGLMTGTYGLDQMKIQPTFILLAFPYLIQKINQLKME